MTAPVETGYGTPRYRGYVLGSFLTIYILAYIDRALVSVVARPMRAEIPISDTGWGLMTGFAFAVFYSTVGLPLARVAERRSRVAMIAVCLAIWSAFTMLCGLAMDVTLFGVTIGAFWILLVCRIGVGIGEAGCSPPINSLIADYFAPGRRASAVAIYSMGVTLGNVCANMIGGPLTDVVGWRWTFILLGAPGILMAAISFFTVRELPRGYSDPAGAAANAEVVPLRDAFRELIGKKSYLLMLGAAACAGFAGYGQATFYSLYWQRQYGLSSGEAGLYLNTPSYLAGAVGTVLVGRFARVLFDRYPSAIGWLSGVGLLLSVPFYLIAFNANTILASAVAMSIATFLTYGYVTSQYAVCQLVASARVRATATAIMLFVISIIGYGLGPIYAGAISDWRYSQIAIETGHRTVERHACDSAQQAVTDARRARKVDHAPAMDPAAYAFCLDANARSTRSAMMGATIFYFLSGLLFIACSRALRRDILR